MKILRIFGFFLVHAVLNPDTVQASLLGGIVGEILNPAPAASNTTLQYTPYYRGPVCTPSDAIRHPISADEVVDIVKEAIKRNTTCKAFGHRHSLSDVICTPGIPIDMRGIQGIVLNEDDTVTVGAGVYLADLTGFLLKKGRALRTTPAFGNITIGGAIGTGAHGSSIKYTSSISEQVVGLTIVDGKGQIQTISDPTDLHAFRVHLGLLGIVLNVTLITKPLYKVKAFNYVVDEDILWNGDAIKWAQETDQISMYWFPSQRKMVIANWTIVNASTPGEAYTFDHVPSTTASLNLVLTSGLEAAQLADNVNVLNVFQAYSFQTLFTKMPDFVPIYTYDGVTVANPAVGYYNHMFAPICNSTGRLQCPWFHGPNNITQLDNEISIDLEDLPEFASTLKDIVSKYSAVFPFTGILLRFSDASETFMSISQGRKSCHFEFYMPVRKNQYSTAATGLAAYQAILQSLAFNYTGRSHWGKTGGYYHTTPLIQRKLDPAARQAFLDKMKQYDPNQVFMNDFGRRLRNESTKMNTDPLVKHCALLDDCVCSRAEDCGPLQSCSRISGYPDYPVCMNPGNVLSVLDPNPNIPPGTTLAQLVKDLLGIVIPL